MQPLPIFSSESIILSLGLHKQTIPIIAINPFNLIFPRQPSAPQSPTLLRGETFQYTAIADGVKNVYTSGDAVLQFSTSGILDPGTFTFASLFINGILQPPNSYVIQPGILILSDVPVQGAPIIIQFVRIISQ
ncbi:DUF4183 domain-containing protein [Brevibacillus thermoruber]|uniref:DUF4183 domain-containing protein n=1 Tax=Brevibacillus thermoruber TaxID=33942 RepID=A0A9X3TRC0_9BACL|nr:DUF4183 domain-containing protein [Brevibacillus thermoruber]MDA5109063.1 DUF4183 domain-containing protein [Brevibacillus thermoruber]